MKRQIRLSLGISLLGLAPFSFAQSGAYVPAYNAPMPYYWSGTNCRAMGEVYPYPPIPWVPITPIITETHLYVGGVLVRSWNGGGPNDIPEYPLTLAVMFDASHFSAAGNIEVKFTAWDNLGRYYEAIGTAPNKNLGRFFNLDEFLDDGGANGADIASDRASEMNYPTIKYISGWNAAFYGARIRESILYVNTHGSHFSHSACGGTFLVPYSNLPAQANYLDSRILHNGPIDGSIGFPPYNSTGLPPINFVDLEACNTGDGENGLPGSAFFPALHPYFNFYNFETIENQLLWSYTVFTVVQDAYDRADLIYYLFSLKYGGTIVKALFLEDAEEKGIYCWDQNPNQYDVDSRPLSNFTDIQLDGDPSMRMKNVWTGISTFETRWFREI